MPKRALGEVQVIRYLEVFALGTGRNGRPRSGTPGNLYENAIAPRFFETLSVPLLAGREFSPRDTERSPRVVIVSESFARAYFPGGAALGHRVQIGSGTPAEVIGVVRDVKYETLREPLHQVFYEPYTQALPGGVYAELRSNARLDSLSTEARQELGEIAAQVPVETVTLRNWIAQFLVQERLVALLSSALGVLASILAAIGLYGVMAYTVARRTGEIGIRMALGAKSTDVRWLILRESLLLAGAGVASGILLSLAAGRFVSSLLFGLSPKDPLVLTFAVVFLSGEAILVGYLPARRASRIDPLQALRNE